MPKPTISLVHSTARPDKWYDTCKKWFDCCDNPNDVEYCLCYEPSKGNYFRAAPWKNLNVAPNEGRACLVDGWNTAASLSTGTLLVGIADDLFPTGPHWDTKLLDVVPETVQQEEAFIWPSTSSESDAYIGIHPILTRRYYERFGYWFYPEYWAVFCDNENWDIAQRDGVVYDIRRTLTFDHRHTTNNKRTGDDVDTNTLSRWAKDEALYKERKAAGFPPWRKK